jgi:hypothetical protein
MDSITSSTTDGSCTTIKLSGTNFSIQQEGCHKKINLLCKSFNSGPILKSYDIPLRTILEQTMVKKFLMHTLNSVSSCAAICGKSQVYINNKACICFEGIVWKIKFSI